jgi:benzoyl-CoA reductase subunit D
MVTAGFDVGAKTTKVVILDNREVLGQSIVSTGIDQPRAAAQALDAALQSIGLRREDIWRMAATGAGRAAIPFIQEHVTEASADARVIALWCPAARTLVDVGAEEARAIRCSPQGKVVDFCINDKCAAGAGAFIEAMAHALEVTVEELGPLSLQSKTVISINAQCTVFAESEVVSLIHALVPKQDIARALHSAIASRISSMVHRVGIEKEVAAVGGLARNVGFVKALEDQLGTEVSVPDAPEFAGALGAALFAQEHRG